MQFPHHFDLISSRFKSLMMFSFESLTPDVNRGP